MVVDMNIYMRFFQRFKRQILDTSRACACKKRSFKSTYHVAIISCCSSWRICAVKIIAIAYGVVQFAGIAFDTIENNIRFGKEEADSEEIITVSKSAVVHENIMGFAKQYETILGERGITLSGGQKQRVSIARALLKDPKIYLFDDCLSAVDTETEEEILKNLKRASEEKTTLIVSHRVSSAKNADKIIVLEDGKILQEGTHTELNARKGYYQKLYQDQLTEKE